MFKFRFVESAADIDEGMANHWRFFVTIQARNNRQIFHEQVERIQLSRKILYHFVNFSNN